MVTETRAPDAAPGNSHHSDGLVLSLVCLAQFMVVLDVSIVNVALPTIREQLHFSQSDLQWVVNTYAIAFAGFLLLGGRIADIFGRRRTFLAGLALFTAASLAGGFAQNQSTLLIARAAQGLGGAVLSPATLTILTTTFPEGPRRSRALGVWSALAGAGGAAGALLGGVLTDLVSWRWILFVNVPIGVVGLIAARLLLIESRDDHGSRKIDLLGSVLVTGGLMTLVLAIVNTDRHPWGSAQTLATLAVAVALLGWFLLHEMHVSVAPLVPLSLFRSRSVSGANLVMFCVGGAVFASWFFLSLYMQTVLGFSPLRTGFAFLPQTAAIIVGAQVSSRLVSRVGPRALLLVAPLVSAAGLLWLSRITPHGTYWGTLFVPSVLVTAGVGLSFTPIAVAGTSGIPRFQAGLASGLVNTTRQVGGALGLAILTTVATDDTLRRLGPHVDRAAAFALGKVSPAVAAALTAGYARAFLLGAGVAVIAAACALALPRLDPRDRTTDVASHLPAGESVGA